MDEGEYRTADGDAEQRDEPVDELLDRVELRPADVILADDLFEPGEVFGQLPGPLVDPDEHRVALHERTRQVIERLLHEGESLGDGVQGFLHGVGESRALAAAE